jgi:hypothetical protein
MKRVPRQSPFDRVAISVDRPQRWDHASTGISQTLDLPCFPRFIKSSARRPRLADNPGDRYIPGGVGRRIVSPGLQVQREDGIDG